MNYFDSITKEQLDQQHFAFLEVNEAENVLSITLDREEKRNAIHPQMVNELAYAMQYAHENKEVWAVLFQAKGKVFCAGADLKAFMGIGLENDSTIPVPKSEILLGVLFNSIHTPTVTKVTGDVYAGGFFFLAGSHIVIAQDDIKFGLPEVKRGLYPFQVMESLMRVMPTRKVLDWCIRGYNLPVSAALEYGLVTEMVSYAEIDKATEAVIDELKQNSPTAIRNGLAALDHLTTASEEHKYLKEMLMKTVTSKDGQEGLTAYREKRTPNWTGE